MQDDRWNSFFKYFAYVIEIILIYFLCSTPGLLPEIYGGKPSLLILVAITIAVFEREISGMIFGLVCGILIDIGYSASIGVFTIGLTIACFILGYVANNIIVAKTFNVLVTSLVIVAILFSLQFVFTYVLKGYGDNGYYFVNHYLSRMIYTFIFTPVFYFLNKFISTTLSTEN